MISDDEGFSSRQVAAATLLRNTTLNNPLPYRTEIFDVSKFSSVAFYLNPSAGSIYPLYVTIEWWIEPTLALGRVATDVVSWSQAGSATSRIWQGQIPCRSDWLALTIDTVGAAAALNMVVVGQSRDLGGKIAQQVVPLGGAGVGPFALASNSQVIAAGTNGVAFFVPPWFGEVEINSHTDAPSAAGCWMQIQALAGAATGNTAMALSNTGGGFTSGGLVWNTRRFAMDGHQLRVVPVNLDVVARTINTTIQPVTGRI